MRWFRDRSLGHVEAWPDNSATAALRAAAKTNRSRDQHEREAEYDEITLSGGALPAGGATGEVLTKTSDVDGAADWEAPGGSGPFERVRLPIAFNTPGLVVGPAPAGIKLATMFTGDKILMASDGGAPGNGLLVGGLDIEEAWDGVSPTLKFVLADDRDPATATQVLGWDLSVADGVYPTFVAPVVGSDSVWNNTLPRSLRWADDVDLYVWVDDNSGNDPGSMQGQGTIDFWVVRAA